MPTLDYAALRTVAKSVLSTFGRDEAEYIIGTQLQKSLELTPDAAKQISKDILDGKSESLEAALASVPKPAMRLLGKSADRLIYGPASVSIVDREGDLITGDALRGALSQFLLRGTISLNHLDICAGRILPEAVVDGLVYRTEVRGVTSEDIVAFPALKLATVPVGTDAMFVVAQIYSDTEYSNQVWKHILKGKMASFSISGQAITENRRVDCKDFSCKLVNYVEKLDGSAVTICEVPMNQAAGFRVVSKSCGCTPNCSNCEVPSG